MPEKFIGLYSSDIKIFTFTVICEGKWTFQNCLILMINYMLKKEQESNDNKDCKAIQFYYQKIVHKRDKKLLKKIMLTFLYWLIIGNSKWQVYGFQQKYIYFIFNILWQAFHIPLHCFAGLGLQAVWEILNFWSQSIDAMNA